MMLSTMMLTVAAVVVHALSTASNYINVVQRDHEWPHQTDSFAPGLFTDTVNPLMGRLKPQSNGSLYSNTVIGTLAVDGWTVTFGRHTARRGKGGLRPRPVPSSLYQM